MHLLFCHLTDTSLNLLSRLAEPLVNTFNGICLGFSTYRPLVNLCPKCSTHSAVCLCLCLSVCLLIDGVILVDPEYLKDRKGSTAFTMLLHMFLEIKWFRCKGGCVSLTPPLPRSLSLCHAHLCVSIRPGGPRRVGSVLQEGPLHLHLPGERQNHVGIPPKWLNG